MIVQGYNTSSEYCYPLGYSLPSPSKCSDWTFSPSAIPTSPYIESPLSSVEAYADPSWNPFDQSIASVQSSVNNGNCVPPGYLPAYSSNAQGDTQPYVSLAAINEINTFDNAMDDRNSHFPDETSPLSSPSINYHSQEPNWGARRTSNPSSFSKPVSQTKHRKSSEKGSHSSKSHYRLSTEPTPRLRSTIQPSRSTTFSSGSSSSKSLAISENSKGRTNHNQVEKKYRNRLNGQFETLLSALPSEDDQDGAKSRISKAEVLMLAKRHIVELEREKVMLEEEHHALESDVEDLKRRFIEMGGVCMP